MVQNSAAFPYCSVDDLAISDVISQIGADTTLPIQRRRDLASSLRSLCRLIGAADPSTVLADVARLRERLKQAPPGARLSDSRLTNIRSDTIAALSRTTV